LPIGSSIDSSVSPLDDFAHRQNKEHGMDCDLGVVELYAPSKQAASPVCSYTEWDALEDVIVGIVEGASFPPWHIALQPVLPTNQHETFRRHAGERFSLDVRPRVRRLG
jgi:hypothetical protein